MYTKSWQRLLIVITAVILSFLLLAHLSVQASGPTRAYRAGQVIVHLEAAADISQINTTYGTTTIRSLANGRATYLLEIPASSDPIGLIQTLQADPQIESAELNFIGYTPEAILGDMQAWGIDVTALPSDLYSWPSDLYSWPSDLYSWPSDLYSWMESEQVTTTLSTMRAVYKWEPTGADGAHYFQQPTVQRLNLDQAHNYSQGSGVIVAVLDTGIDYTHPLFISHLVPGYDFVDNDPTPEDAIDGQDHDGDGLVNEVAGHGTHIAGIVRLVAPQAQIMPLRVLDPDGQGDSFEVARAILYAIENGATVINMSLGAMIPSAILLDMVEEAAASGVVVVAAAGNLNNTKPIYPAASPCALGVTSVNTGWVKSSYASYGSWVDLAAPGERIFSAFPGGNFGWWRGTSMSVPFVAGQVALLQSLNPALTLAQTSQLVAGTAHPLDAQNPAYNGWLGAGEVDIGASVSQLAVGQWPAVAPDLFAGCGS